MERREDIRAAMQSLLAPGKRRETRLTPPVRLRPEPPALNNEATPAGALALNAGQLDVLNAIRATLNEFGVDAEPPEMVQAMLEALLARPMLCRGLLAAYLTEAA